MTIALAISILFLNHSLRLTGMEYLTGTVNDTMRKESKTSAIVGALAMFVATFLVVAGW